MSNSFPSTYPRRLRNVGWVTEYACGPKKRFERAHMFSRTDDFYRPLFHDEMLRNWFFANGKSGLKYDEIIRYFIKCFTVCFTERRGFYLSEKKFDIGVFSRLCNANEETSEKVLEMMKNASLDFYKNIKN